MKDNYDSLLLLRKDVVSKLEKSCDRNSEWSSKLDVLQECIQSIETTLISLKAMEASSEDITEDALKPVRDAIHSIETSLGVSSADLLQHELKGRTVSDSLYFHEARGVIAYDKVRQLPSFPIRGRQYMIDGKKVESAGSLFHLRAIQMVSFDEFRTHVVQEPWCAFPRFPHENEWLVINIMIPGATPVQVIMLFTASPEVKNILHDPHLKFDTSQNRHKALQHMHTMGHNKKAMIRLLRKFWLADQAYCDERCKMIPTIVEGTWAIKMAVGQKPVMLGQKISQQYYRGEGYFEIDVDLSSSVIATHILGLVRGVSKDMVVDLGITIQGEIEEELPEVILCQARFDHVDLESATYIP